MAEAPPNAQPADSDAWAGAVLPSVAPEPPVHPEPLTIYPEDPDDEWVTSANAGRAFRVRALTGALVLLLVLAGGFWGGVVAEKHHGSGSASSASLAARFAAARAAAGGGGLAFGAGAGGAGAVTGTVIDVQGDTVDISDSSGNIVKVKVGPSTTVTRTAKVGPSGLQIGDTVVVTGQSGAGGTVSATAVRATAQGVASGGGFGGLRSGSAAGGG
jgi:hypothetical protein